MSANGSYSIRDYGWMLNDTIRTGAYVEALRQAVVPGKVVLDIGTGTGFFALLACRFGASRVYAIEPDQAIGVAKLCAGSNLNSERITWIQDLSTRVDLPERVDVVIGDLRGALPFHPGNLRAFIDARQRHLKPGGHVIPRRDLLFAAPAGGAAEYQNVTSPWWTNEHGIDFSEGRRFVTNSIWRAKSEAVPADEMLASPQSWGSIEYARVDSPNLDGAVRFAISRSGEFRGFYVWFDTELADGVGFSNAPTLAPLVYGRMFFPLSRPLEVVVGDTVELRISAHLIEGDYIFRWNTRLLNSDGETKGDFRQSTFQGRLVEPRRLDRISSSFVPTLTEDGRVDSWILGAMGGSRPLGAIAAELAARYPAKFPSEAEALARVAKLSAVYSG